mmetsp:Transcript_26698/g.75757  ORF Transcript_26698/g.75757 Transcript_26698/m.75757 type:complete len:95 (-) Transcript_26698:217-501(-)|eukprot:CAMPEP_0176186890 /NCGR_PEP_ID=MMETSP0121_2-20121125/2106_1 /TAXON_ID=160619 /ORGANISM="Kryptoperidinium foliaceum, Strain CCMP 1326" /LENGTH=94 /DNA_ID=CAMNT_0017525395 /DNA_START=132 /DNA_END=416 /DNA_ORIENTATION=+
MTRGDQRERDRAKRQAKEAAKSKGAGREGTPLLRNENDKAALEAKVAAKKAQKAAEAESGTPTAAPVVRKKVPKKEDLNDLLSAGLTKVAKSKK